MSVQCVRVDREAGEETRQRLAEADLVEDGYDIVVEDGWLYIPVTDPAAVPGEFDVVARDLPVRETQTMPGDLVDFTASYERIGDVIVVDEDDPERAAALADALMASDLPVRTVLNRASKIKGRRACATGRYSPETARRRSTASTAASSLSTWRRCTSRPGWPPSATVSSSRLRRANGPSTCSPASVRSWSPSQSAAPSASAVTSTRRPSSTSGRTPSETASPTGSPRSRGRP